MVNSVEILIRAIDQASATFDSIGKKGVGMSHDLESACIKAGAVLTGIGVSAKLMADDINKAFLGFDRAMTEVRGLGVVGEEFDALRQKALDLSKTVPIAADDIANAMYLMVSVGWDYNEMMTAIDPATQLAVAGSVELSEATNALINAMAAYSDEGLTAAQASEIFAKGVGVGKWELQDFLNEMMNNINVAASLGISFQELAGYNVALQNAFTDSSTAGTALRGVLVNLTETKTLDMLEEMGIQVKDNTGNFRGLGNIMQDLNKYFERHAGTVDKNNKLGELFGQRSINAALALMREASAAGESGSRLDDLVASMSDGTFIQEQFAAKVESAGNKLEIANNKMTAAKITLGEAMAPATLIAADAMGKFAGILENLPDPLQGLIGAFLTFGQALIPLGPLLIALPTIMGAIAPAATLLAGVAGGLSTVLGGAGASAAVAGTSLGAIGITIGSLIPIIGVVITTVAALYLAWTTNFMGIQEKAKVVFDFLTDRFKVVMDVFGKVGDALGKAGGKILEAFGKLYEKLDGVFRKLSGGTSIMEVFTKVVTAMGYAWDIAWKLLGKAMDGAIDAIAGGIGWLIDKIGALVDWFGKLMDNPVAKWLINTVGGAIDWVTDKIDLGNDALAAYSKSLDGVSDTTDTVTDALGVLADSAKDLGSEVEISGGAVEAALRSAGTVGEAALAELEEEFIRNGGTSEEWAEIVKANSAEINAAWSQGATKDLNINADSTPAIAPGTTPSAGTPANQNGKWMQVDSGQWYYTDTSGRTSPVSNYGEVPAGSGSPSDAGTSGDPLANVEFEDPYATGYINQGVNYSFSPNDPTKTPGSGMRGTIAVLNDAGKAIYTFSGYFNEFEDLVKSVGKEVEITTREQENQYGDLITCYGAVGDAVEQTAEVAGSSAKMVEASNETIAESHTETGQKSTSAVKTSNEAIADSHTETAQKSVSAADQMRAAMLEKMAAMRGGTTAESETMATEVSGAASRMRISSAAEAANMADIVKAKFAEMSASAQGINTGSGAGSSGGSGYSSEMCPFGETGIPTGRGAGQVNSVGNGVITTQGYVSATGNTGFRSKAYQQAQGLLPCAAKGGEVTDEGIVLVGEQGPEVVRLPRGAKVSSTSQTQRAARQNESSAKREIHHHWHIGTFVGDKAGLRKLQRLLDGIEINENVRKGMSSVHPLI